MIVCPHCEREKDFSGDLYLEDLRKPHIVKNHGWYCAFCDPQ